MMRTMKAPDGRPSARLVAVWAVVGAQAIATLYFIADVAIDISEQSRNVFSFEIMMDCVVALSLIAGFVVGADYARQMNRKLIRWDQALAIARGALAEQMSLRFDQWRLTASEAEIALFAMKGCNVTEIAAMRSAAVGTVRSQLSQIYAKAGVSSQAMLVSLIIEDLLGPREDD